uniref:Uncharacterized protein n=1 Tax=Brassica campestris TaxID=3711 RepID=A0A3P6BWE3_BRACM|nr:unnamed protein product [Brassica rapa]
MVILGLPLIDHTGFAGAASRYLGLKTVMQLLGPMLARSLFGRLKHQNICLILRAIYAFAHSLKGILLFIFQIRITRTCWLPCK